MFNTAYCLDGHGIRVPVERKDESRLEIYISLLDNSQALLKEAFESARNAVQVGAEVEHVDEMMCVTVSGSSTDTLQFQMHLMDEGVLISTTKSR
mgnify:CR=1 FL=1